LLSRRHRPEGCLALVQADKHNCKDKRNSDHAATECNKIARSLEDAVHPTQWLPPG